MAEVLKETLLQFLCCHQTALGRKISQQSILSRGTRDPFTLVKRRGRKKKATASRQFSASDKKPKEPAQCFKHQIVKLGKWYQHQKQVCTALQVNHGTSLLLIKVCTKK